MNLQKLVRLRKRADDQLDSRFLKLFLRFNENKDDFIDDGELQEVLTSFDILFDETVKSCIREISPKSKQGLQKPEFHMLLRVLLCKRELIAVFRKYCPEFTDQLLVGSTVRSCMTPFMLQADFEKFLKEEQ
jgi:Ca2+-binding EF-hand superfamily protein